MILYHAERKWTSDSDSGRASDKTFELVPCNLVTYIRINNNKTSATA